MPCIDSLQIKHDAVGIHDKKSHSDLQRNAANMKPASDSPMRLFIKNDLADQNLGCIHDSLVANVSFHPVET